MSNLKAPHALVGKTILAVALSMDKETIRFTVLDDTGTFTFVYGLCCGDCCSSTWVEAVESSARGLPAKVLSAGDLELNKDATDDGGDYVQYYGFLIETDQGAITIDYRNSSNGYYGGDMEWQVGENGRSGTLLLTQTYTKVEV